MFLRALRIVSPQFFDREISRICNLKYNEFFFKDCFNRAKKYFYSVDVRDQLDFKNSLKLPYHYSFFDLVQIVKSFNNIRLVFTYSDTVKKLLIKNFVSTNVDVGIYRINCSNCTDFYFGQTDRFKDRIKEHQRDIRNVNEVKCLFRHVRDEDHFLIGEKVN